MQTLDSEDPLVEDVRRFTADQETKAKLDRLERLQAFQSMMVTKRQAAITSRAASGVEKRWLDDLNNYHGVDASTRVRTFLDGLAGQGVAQNNTAARNAKRATLFVQMSRQKTNTASARLADKLFPSDDKNWSIDATVVPQLLSLAKQDPNKIVTENGQPLIVDGQPVTVGAVAKDVKKEADRKAANMESLIEDQLDECGYNAEGRKVIRDAAILGTGVLKGPISTNRVKKKWARQQDEMGKTFFELNREMDLTPVSKRVDTWNFYPAPGCGEDFHDGDHVFERELMSGTALRVLATQEGYDKAAIAECLREGPLHFSATGPDSRRMSVDGYLEITAQDRTNYEIWTFTGALSVEDLAVHGIGTFDDTTSDEAMLTSYSAIVIMCNNRVIKVTLNPMTGGELPYDVFRWEYVSGSMWGVGIPFLMRYAQQIVNAAVRALLDNAGLSHGPQVVMNRSMIEPANKDWTITGRKLWVAKNNTEDVRKAFAIFDIPSRQAELINIVNLGLKFADEETSVPMLLQGEKGTAPDTVGVQQMLLNAANVILSDQAKHWDDDITIRHLARYFDFNMEFSKDDDVKGDMQVKARGHTHLIVRDQQKQDLANIMGLVMNDPDAAMIFNKKKLYARIAQASSLNDVMNTEEEIKELMDQQAQNPPPPDPRIEAAKIKAQADMERAKMQTEGAIAAEQVEAESERANIEMRAEAERRNDEREMIKLEYELAALKAKLAIETKNQLDANKVKLVTEQAKLMAKTRSDEIAAGTARMGKFDPSPLQ